MKELIFESQNKEEVIDITEKVEEAIYKDSKGERSEEGLCHLFLLHTTASLGLADLDPGTDLDMLDAFREMIPKLKYRHPHNPLHVKDHILSTLVGTSLLIPVRKGKLVLGTWQRVVLFEFDGPRERKVVCTLIPAGKYEV